MNRTDTLAVVNRRSVLSAGWISMLQVAGMARQSRAGFTTPAGPFFKTRGVVITPRDVTLGNWPERARQAGLSTIALHPFPGTVLNFVRTDDGQKFVEQCRRLGLQVEYELHAMRELLPRSLFLKDKSLFRMNMNGDRVADANLCVRSSTALEIAAENALRFARSLQPTTLRYFFWGDDGQPWCRCPRCRGLSDSDQVLQFENHLIKAIRTLHPAAALAHLAYASTLPPPRELKPEPGIFLEHAPIKRRYDIPYAEQNAPDQPDSLRRLMPTSSSFPPPRRRFWNTGSTCPGSRDGSGPPCVFPGDETCWRLTWQPMDLGASATSRRSPFTSTPSIAGCMVSRLSFENTVMPSWRSAATARALLSRVAGEPGNMRSVMATINYK